MDCDAVSGRPDAGMPALLVPVGGPLRPQSAKSLLQLNIRQINSLADYMCQEKMTLIPPQLSPLFAPNTKKEPRVERESQLA